jgi:hypothetical protein
MSADLPVRKPVLERLKERAAVEHAKPPPTPEEAKHAARENLVAQLAEERDPDRIKTLASALVALDKLDSDDADEPAEREALDLSGMCDACLSIFAEAHAPPEERERLRKANREHHEREQAQRDRDRQVAGVLEWMIGGGRGGHGPQDMIRRLEKHGFRLDAEVRAMIESRAFDATTYDPARFR